MKTFLDNRRDGAIWNCGMYAGIALGWTLEPALRWAVVPFLGEPPFPIPAFQTIFCLGLSVAAAMIIEARDKEHARNQGGDQ